MKTALLIIWIAMQLILWICIIYNGLQFITTDIFEDRVISGIAMIIELIVFYNSLIKTEVNIEKKDKGY